MKLPDIRKNARWYVSIILFSVSTLSTLAVFIMVLYMICCLSPVDTNSKSTQLKIVPGMSSMAIANQLARKNLVHSPWVFLFATLLSDASHRLQVGSYRLSGAMSVPQIIDHLKTGKIVTHQLVVPEGLTVVQIGKLWEGDGFGTAAMFNQVANNSKWHLNYKIEGQTLEGYLFPDTYQFPDGTPPQVVIQMMLDESDRRWTTRLSEEAESLGLSRHEVITLASIIEKEARAPDERPVISAVFHNRLRRGWKLQADPTALYGIGSPNRPPTPADLRVDSPYNTYLYGGLPPGPICNPSMASILAALRPASVDYMFFVAIGGGRHHFSTTLREHQNMIKKIRQNRNSIAD